MAVPSLLAGIHILIGDDEAALRWAEREEAAIPEGDAYDIARIAARLRVAQAFRMMGDAAEVDHWLALVEADLPRVRARCSGRCLTWSLASALSLRGRNDDAVATRQAGLGDGWLHSCPSEGSLA